MKYIVSIPNKPPIITDKTNLTKVISKMIESGADTVTVKTVKDKPNRLKDWYRRNQ